MAVDAVVGDVELAAGEPLRERQLPLEVSSKASVQLDPLARALGPERLEVGLGLGVQVLGRVGLGGEGRVGGKSRDSARRFRSQAAEAGARRSRVPRFEACLAGPSYRAPRTSRDRDGAPSTRPASPPGRLGRCRPSASRSPRRRSQRRSTRPCRPRSPRSRRRAAGRGDRLPARDRAARPPRPGRAGAGRDAGAIERRSARSRRGAPAPGSSTIVGAERPTPAGREIVSVVFDADGTPARRAGQDADRPERGGAGTCPGAAVGSFTAGGLTFGIAICHEAFRYPEIARSLVLAGAQVVFVPHFVTTDDGSLPDRWCDAANPYNEKAHHVPGAGEHGSSRRPTRPAPTRARSPASSTRTGRWSRAWPTARSASWRRTSSSRGRIGASPCAGRPSGAPATGEAPADARPVTG